MILFYHKVFFSNDLTRHCYSHFILHSLLTWLKFCFWFSLLEIKSYFKDDGLPINTVDSEIPRVVPKLLDTMTTSKVVIWDNQHIFMYIVEALLSNIHSKLSCLIDTSSCSETYCLMPVMCYLLWACVVFAMSIYICPYQLNCPFSKSQLGCS